MSALKIIPTGTKIAKLTFIEDSGFSDANHRKRVAKFLCDCGNEKLIRVNDWKSGKTKTCGNCKDRKIVFKVAKTEDYYSKVAAYFKEKLPSPLRNTNYVYAFFEEGIPFYVGKGINGRISDHFQPNSLKKRHHKNHKIMKIYETSGKFSADILSYHDNSDSAISCEGFLIEQYGRRLNGGLLCNLSEGGQGTTGVYPSEETRKKRSLKQSGENNPFYGKTHSDSTKEKIRKSASRPGYLRNAKTHEMWKRADEVYNIWVEKGYGSKLLSRHFGYHYELKCFLTMTKRFSNGWNPTKDSVWTNWRDNNALEI